MWMLVAQREDFIIGAGVVGSYIVAQLLKDKASGFVKDVVALTRKVCKFMQNSD